MFIIGVGNVFAPTPPEIAVERQPVFRRGRARRRHRYRENRIRSQAALVLRAIEFNHLPIKCALIGSIQIRHRFRDLAIDVLYRFQNSFTLKTSLVPVAQLDGLMLACRCSAWDNRPPNRPAHELHFRFYGRIAT